MRGALFMGSHFSKNPLILILLVFIPRWIRICNPYPILRRFVIAWRITNSLSIRCGLQIRNENGEQLPLILILLAFIGLGFLYDVNVPLFEKPDELKHFAMIQFIHTQWQLPTVKVGVYQLWDQEGTQPPLYHLLVAALTTPLDLSNFTEPPRNPHYADDRSFLWRERGNNNLYLHPDEMRRTDPISLAARLARWLSLLAGLTTIVLTYLLAQLVYVGQTSVCPAQSENRNYLPVLTAAFVAFIPQFIHVSTAISNDGLSAILATAALVILALVIKHGNSPRYAIALGVILGLAAITKLSLLYLLPLTLFVYLFDFRMAISPPRNLAISQSRNLALRLSLIPPILFILIAGWWYWRNWQLYGDFSALSAHLLYRGGPLNPTPTLAQLWQTELTGLEISFWAAFGAGQILLEPTLYTALRWVRYLASFGLIIGILRGKRFSHCLPSPLEGEGSGVRVGILILLISWVLIIFIALLRWMQITPASWGRLLYPALPAIGILVVWGLAMVGQLIAQIFIRHAKIVAYSPLILPTLLVIGLFTLSLISPFRYLQPAYAKTPLIAETAIPADGLQPLNLIYDDTLRLIGYHVGKSTVQTGEWLPVTLYWQLLRPTDKNYSAFVHLLANGTVIGQANSYPDGGKWPTSMLQTGQLLPDTHYIFISPETPAPAVIRLAMGIFEFTDPQRTAKIAVNKDNQTVEPIFGNIPLTPLHWPKLSPSHLLQANFADQIKLVGYDFPAQAIKKGEAVSLTLYWETLTPPTKNLNLFIHLIDNRTQSQVAGFDGPPNYPTAFWQTGNSLIDSRSLTMPADVPDGNYRLLIGWYDLNTFARLPLQSSGDTLSLLELGITN